MLFTSAPALISNLTQSRCPCRTAMWRGDQGAPPESNKKKQNCEKESVQHRNNQEFQNKLVGTSVTCLHVGSLQAQGCLENKDWRPETPKKMKDPLQNESSYFMNSLWSTPNFHGGNISLCCKCQTSETAGPGKLRLCFLSLCFLGGLCLWGFHFLRCLRFLDYQHF